MLACRGLVLASAGLWLGALASTVTSDALKPLGPTPRLAGAEPAVAPEPVGPAIAWARSAYAFGLRDCPRVTESYYAACMAQMREEARLAEAWRAEQARWAAAEPMPVYVPEPALAEDVPDQPVRAVYAPDDDVEGTAPPAVDDVDGWVAPPEVSSPPAG